jgi:hypothetical protein
MDNYWRCDFITNHAEEGAVANTAPVLSPVVVTSTDMAPILLLYQPVQQPENGLDGPGFESGPEQVILSLL